VVALTARDSRCHQASSSSAASDGVEVLKGATIWPIENEPKAAARKHKIKAGFEDIAIAIDFRAPFTPRITAGWVGYRKNYSASRELQAGNARNKTRAIAKSE
jgi:hypothetical protein